MNRDCRARRRGTGVPAVIPGWKPGLPILSRLRRLATKAYEIRGIKLLCAWSLAALFLCLQPPGPTAFAEAEAEDKAVAFTFERLPAMSPMGYWRPREISRLILRALDRHKVPATGFVIEEKIDDDTSTYFVLVDWAEASHGLGSNTYAYVDLHELSADDFLQHIADGQKYLRRAARIKRINFRYLRFPLLHEGDSPSKKKEVARRLRNGGYTLAPVTIKTSDHSFNRPFLELESRSEEAELLGDRFVEHIRDCLDYAESQSEKVFGRQIRHILQLHAGIATAMHLDRVIQLFQERGYRFITVEEALEDPLYESEETYAGPHGLTFTDRVADTRGIPYDPSVGEFQLGEVERLLGGRR